MFLNANQSSRSLRQGKKAHNGFEPLTAKLTAWCSTTELIRQNGGIIEFG
jgi:hypothetical protein